MNYKAFYRTYRPTSFSEVVGQDHIVRTLVNLINMDKISHGYLFCGPKGTGKTSIAKIFANAINCIHSEKKEDICERCKSTMNINLDVIEMDAASNNSVNDIRVIRDQVEFRPTNSRYKIYIIDEAHMLTHGAFNALLMTLEEPPKHVIFILATTDPDKIPDTILSRVQRYNFKRISKDIVKNQLKKVFDEEKIQYDDESIETIATLSNGSLRDALSIADQLNAYTNSKITIKQVIDIFGLSTVESQINLINLISQKEIGKALEYFDSLIANGNDIYKLITSLVNLLKDYLVYKKTSNINLTQIQNSQLLDQIILKSESTYKVLDILIQLLIDIKTSDIPQQLCHLAIIKISSFEENLIDIEKRNEIQKQNISEPENKNNVETEYLDITEAYFNNQKQDIELNDIQKSSEVISETQTILKDFSKTRIQNDINEILDDINFDNDKKEPKKSENIESFNQNDEIKQTTPINLEPEDNILDQTTELLNLSNEEDGFEQEVNESLLISDDASNLKSDEIFDTNEISISAIENPETVYPKDEKNKLVDEEKTKEFNFEETEKNQLENNINNNEQNTLSQHDIVNLFLLSKKDTFDIFKEKLQKATIATEEEFDSYSVLVKEVKFVCSANEFVLVSSSENWVINDINQKSKEPKFKSFISKYLGNNIHFFAITKNEYILSKELFTELKKHDKLPEARPLNFINNNLNDEDQKKEIEINEVESKSKLLFGNLFSRKKE